MTTDPSTLPQYKGRPVPWVTRFSGEIIGKPYTLQLEPKTGKLRTVYGDDLYEDRFGGTLWQREGLMRGGEPQWKQVNTYRQRFAMHRCACQVCGNKITEKPVRFLMPLKPIDGLEILPPDEHCDEEQAITIQAPTCSECIPLALRLCPNLKATGYYILKVTKYHLWGVYGEVVFLDQQRRTKRIQTYVEYNSKAYGPNFSMGQIMAKQLVIRLDKYVVQERHEPALITPGGSPIGGITS